MHVVYELNIIGLVVGDDPARRSVEAALHVVVRGDARRCFASKNEGGARSQALDPASGVASLETVLPWRGWEAFMLIGFRRMVSVLGAASAVWLLTAGPASGEEAALVTSSQDCSKGCVDCQKACHEVMCMRACSMQWSGCCMTAGMKPPAAGSCACTQ